jgi:hypothetical protein
MLGRRPGPRPRWRATRTTSAPGTAVVTGIYLCDVCAWHEILGMEINAAVLTEIYLCDVCAWHEILGMEIIAAVLTGIYLCDVSSWHEILRRNGRGGRRLVALADLRAARSGDPVISKSVIS